MVFRNVFCSVAILLSLASCSDSLVLSDEIDGTGFDGVNETLLTAGIVHSRTVLEGTKTYWTGGDRIAVNGVASYPLGEDYEAADKAVFRLNGSIDGPYSAVFPSTIYKDANTVTLPAVQEYHPSSFAASASPMLAWAEKGTDLTFFHPCAVLRFRLLTDGHSCPVSYIEFKGNNDEQVCGDFIADHQNVTLTPSGTGRSLKLVFPEKQEAGAPVLVHMVIPAQKYSGGFTVRVVDTKGHFMDVSTSERDVRKGVIYDMPDLDFIPVGTILASGTDEVEAPVRILGVGNSWTRDSMRWLSAIASSAGRQVIVGHAYLGGSTLEDQYKGIDDLTYTYVHSGKNQIVHSTYQYWKYAGTVDPVKTPDAGYENGLAGIGVTLESVVTDEPWDIVVFQPHVIVRSFLPSFGSFDINDLVARIKEMMDPEVASDVRCGLMVPFSFAEGNADYRQTVVDAYNDGVWPSSQDEWNALYERMHSYIQEDAAALASHMGNSCEFMINVGKAIYDARKDDALKVFGFNLQRSRTDTHLAEGIPMYIAGLCYAYVLLGISPDDVDFFPSRSKCVSWSETDGAYVEKTVSNTEQDAKAARTVSWNACCHK